MNRREFLQSSTLATTVGLRSTGALASSGPASTFTAGFAERDITPEIGMERPGGYRKSYLESFHDPCKVRAAVFDDGSQPVALVGVDALIVPRKLVLEARAGIQRQCKLSPDRVLIGASHSHSSGPLGMVQPGEYDHASPLAQRLAYEESSCANPAYLEKVKDEIVAAVCQAWDGRKEALCGAGTGIEDQVAFNRRFRMKNGLTYTHPGQGNPDIIEVAGPIDPEVGVIGAWDREGRPLGCIVNYACHATTNPPGISANWIFYMEQMIRGGWKADVPVVFLAGACGDITQVDNLSPYKRTSGEDEARLVGGRVGAETLKVLLSVTRGTLLPLGAASKLISIDRRPPSPERVRRSKELVERGPEAVGSTAWTFAKEIVLLDALMQREKQVELEVQAIQVGPTVFVSNPSEFFCQLGLDIKHGSNFPLTFPVELANGSVGYVPTREAFGPGGGGYETRLTSYSNLVIDAGPRIVEASLDVARRLTPGKLPQPEKVANFKGQEDSIGPTPWSYGAVPPELS